jgi:enoyl-CoA hydratase/carnithine racemase
VPNALDGPTVERLAAAFRSFETHLARALAILIGAGGTFCASAEDHLCGISWRVPDAAASWAASPAPVWRPRQN